MNVHSTSPDALRVRPLRLWSRLTSLTLAQAGTVTTFSLVALLAVRPTSDPDKFWHLGAGRWIWANRTIPKTDPFSWTTPGRSWVAHEWLTELVWFRVYQLGGQMGLALLTAAIIVSGLLLTHRNLRTVGSSTTSANVLVLIAALASLVTWGVRPQMLSVLLIAFVGHLTLEAWRSSRVDSADVGVRRRRLWTIVPMMLIWANAHGGYVFGIALLGAFAVGLSAEHLLGRNAAYRAARPETISYVDLRLIRSAWAVTVASILITLANPHGIGGLVYPFTYLGDNASTRYVAEWFAPTFSDPQFWPFAVLLMLAAFALIRLRRSIPLFAVIQILALAVLGVQSIRNVSPFAVVALPWIGVAVKRSRARERTFPRTLPKGAGTIHAGVAAFAIAATVVIGVPSVRSAAIETHDAESYPSAAVAWLEANPRARILNQYDWGGYLIWNLPTTPVAVDGRPDMYGDAFMDRHVSIWHTHKGWEQRLDADNYDRVFGAPKAQIVTKLRSNPRWRVVYEDAHAVVIDRL